jgi:hypothetical protein
MKYTKAYVKEILNDWKDKSVFFNGSMTVAQCEMQLHSLGISYADSITITMALVIAGAKFSD